MYVRGKGTINREKIISLLESKGYALSKDEPRGRDEIINSNLPIGFNPNDHTYNMIGNITCAAALCTQGGLWEDDKFFAYFEADDEVVRATKRVNTVKFSMELWDKVKLVKNENGESIFTNAEYINHQYYPRIKVSGYNELNGCDEEFDLPCWYMESDESISDYIESGDTPALAYPNDVYMEVETHKINLHADLCEAEESLKAAKYAKEHINDAAIYYLIGNGLVGKREKRIEIVDYLFFEDNWEIDDEYIITKLLNGEDLTKQSFRSFDPETTEIINSIKEIDRQEAMEIITDQTIEYLKMLWEEKFAKEKEEWDKAPKWWAKCVSKEFILNGVKRTLYPEDLPFASGPSIEGFMESISGEIDKDLRERGAFIVANNGMID